MAPLHLFLPLPLRLTRLFNNLSLYCSPCSLFRGPQCLSTYEVVQEEGEEKEEEAGGGCRDEEEEIAAPVLSLTSAGASAQHDDVTVRN